MNPADPSTTCAVLHRDKWLLAVDKPSGVLSHPNPGAPPTRQARCAFEGPYDAADRRFDGPGGPVWLVHRLDQATSGVLLAALDPASASRCREAFEQGLVEKRYSALLVGIFARSQGIWKDALVERRAAGRIRVSVQQGAPLNAELRYQVSASSTAARLSLVDLLLVTGRTHQIRVQGASRRHPLLGDDVYGDFAVNRRARKDLGLRRLFLHAASLRLPHPTTGKPLVLASPLPEELTQVLKKLRF